MYINSGILTNIEYRSLIILQIFQLIICIVDTIMMILLSIAFLYMYTQPMRIKERHCLPTWVFIFIYVSVFLFLISFTFIHALDTMR